MSMVKEIVLGVGEGDGDTSTTESASLRTAISEAVEAEEHAIKGTVQVSLASAGQPPTRNPIVTMVI